VREALAMALAERPSGSGLLFHSDRGGQYLSATVQELLDAHGSVASTSRPGACLDNAVAESFFHSLKTECVYHHRYRTREEARLVIFDYIAASTTGSAGTRASGIAPPRSTKPRMLSLNPTSTFLGQDQSAGCAS
jgi:hypothetical protein